MSDSDIELARRAIALLDLTDLTDDASAADRPAVRAGGAARHGGGLRVARLRRPVGRRARRHPVRGRDSRQLPGRRRATARRRVLTERALADGADEIDMVLPYRALLAGDDERPPT